MSLTEEELSSIREKIENSHRPMIFFDDDADGLSSFLQVYKFIGDGKGVPVKNSPEVDEYCARRVREYQPDLVIILDKPYVNDEFIRQVKVETIWIDHHEPQESRGNIKYYNPRKNDDADNRPTSYWVYRALQKNLWVAMVGIIGDWHYPEDLADEFREKYPGMLPDDITTPEAAIHDSLVGKMVRIWSFNMKGTVRDTLSSIKTLTRIEEPDEILEQKSARGKYIYKKYDKLIERYNELLQSVEVPEGKLLVFTYGDDNSSYTSDLSNEILYRHPEKVIIIGRHDNGFYKCSVRSSDIDVEAILQKCLQGVEGQGGGHKNACGCAVRDKDFDDFLTCFRKSLE